MTAEADGPLRDLCERARGPDKTVTTFGPDPYADLEPVLEQFDVTLAHEYLPLPESEGYLTVSVDGRSVGSISAAAFGELRDPDSGLPWDAATRESAYRDLVELLAGTAFVMDDKGHLLATAREIEDRAFRHGRGHLYAAFQSLSAFRAQVPVYERLVGRTDLRATVFGAPDWEPPEVDRLTVRLDDADDVTDFWVVAFDGAGDDDAKCAMIAEEVEPGEYTGVVTYDPVIVDDLTAYLDEVG
ncbi:DICT sensory domain-containing protein [Halosimplex aquaticum]|uniref:DICT sensory domain-containing protein n=1 Tax=Halosimplex aquaticum TaxID=3026162 RepID=A0ABD5XUB7_9EURY|nr:DICT sensory domain-containing protein [Halosimplex aquaticum]